jgi:hypothetical protein
MSYFQEETLLPAQPMLEAFVPAGIIENLARILDSLAWYTPEGCWSVAAIRAGDYLHPSSIEAGSRSGSRFSFMRKLAFISLLLLVFGSSSIAFAQKRVEVGAFLDYLSISKTGTHNFGIGGRFGYRVHRNVMMEGELAYDYGLNFDEAFRNVVTGNLIAIGRTSIGVTHGVFGPKLQSSHGPFRPFITFKGGFVDFRFSPSLVPYSNVVSALTGIRTSNLNAAIYPGGGIEASLGPVGLRLEVGDEIYFNNGAQNNLRITFGPIIRF